MYTMSEKYQIWSIAERDGSLIKHCEVQEMYMYMKIVQFHSRPPLILIGFRFAMTWSSLISGKIINIETVTIPFTGSYKEVNPDGCYWKIDGNFNMHFLYFIRIYYLCGQPIPEEIG